MDSNADGEAEDDTDDLSEIKAQMPLQEGVLKVNLGIPIIVVCNKIDLLLRGEKAPFLEQNLDFIQKHLRNYCLSYAASLIFVETITPTNVELLYRYILHRLYDFEFNIKAQVYEKDSLFIPTGFDSQLLINELCKDPGDGE
jgi:dynein light intermediate chain 1